MAIGDIKIRTVTRKNGTTYKVYQGEYRDRDEERRFVSDENKKEAQRKLREAIKEVEDHTHAKGPETLQQVIDEYIYDREKAARRGDVSNAGVKAARDALRRVPDRIRRKKIASFKHSGEIEEALNAMRDQGYAVATVILTKEALIRVFDFAMTPQRRYVARNVLRDFPVKVGKAPKRKNKASLSEAALLLHTARELIQGRSQCILGAVNLYAFLVLTIHTGARPEEICGLQITDIKRFDRPPPDRPHVWAEMTIQHTNTMDDGFRRRTKTEEVRVVPLGRTAVDALDMVERHWQAKRYATQPGHASYTRTKISKRLVRYFKTSDEPLERRQHGFVFIGAYGKPYDASSIGMRVRELVLRAGIVQRDGDGRILIGENGKPKARISLYSFRHMVATYNAHRIPTHVGAAITGHSEETYLGTYVHLSPDDQVLVAKSLGDLERELEAERSATNLQQRLLTSRF